MSFIIRSTNVLIAKSLLIDSTNLVKHRVTHDGLRTYGDSLNKGSGIPFPSPRLNADPRDRFVSKIEFTIDYLLQS